MKMSGESARTTEVMEAERNCSAETNAGTGKWWRQSLLMSSSEEEAAIHPLYYVVGPVWPRNTPKHTF